MSVYNKTDDTIQLQGDRSSVVDPSGQVTRCAASRSRQSFIKLILPPYRPTIQLLAGPSFGIGVGTRIGDRRRLHDGFNDDDYAYEPQYLAVIDDDSMYWNWSGEGEIRLALGSCARTIHSLTSS